MAKDQEKLDHVKSAKTPAQEAIDAKFAKYLKPYDPKVTEAAIYKIWEGSGFFNPDNCEDFIEKPPQNIRNTKSIQDSKNPAGGSTPFTIVLPPPNVTGTLHIGHASMLVIEDIMVRFERMRGKRTLWIPGTDHAAIATQSKVEAVIYKEEKKRRHDIGRDELLKRINEFAAASQDTIINQVKRMGASVDWSRLAFTLDKERELAVYTAFKQMYDDGLIYRGHRIVNWDPKGQTTISDDEIVYVEEKTKFYYFKYGPFTIGTSRPETKFGDKYVVMHPDDERYAKYKHGEQFELEWINGPITATVIKDEAIDMTFGTGVMTITPWHSVIDFEIAERHSLDKEQIIDKIGKLLPIAGSEFAGMKIADARAKIVDKLRSKGLVTGEEDYTHNVATAERTGGIIEPQIMNQWFVDVNKKFPFKAADHYADGSKPDGVKGIKPGDLVSLKELMRASVRDAEQQGSPAAGGGSQSDRSGQIEILPNRFSKVYFHWIDNLRDWCISRQIWYGHRIPVWYRGEEIYCGTEAPKADTNGEGWIQDEDTLDTWFSSGLWTFSTLGWPDAEKFAKNRNQFHHHPNSVLETGYDILFFWVARMILMSTYLLGEIPFKTVYLHGLVRDAKGTKMSKSLGNIIDPLDVSDKFGTDAVRMSLIVGTGPGNDLKMSEDKIKAYKNFANKLWNVARFVFTNTADFDPKAFDGQELDRYSHQEINIIQLFDLSNTITYEMECFNYHIAAERIYHYIWHTFADKIIEWSKITLADKTDPRKRWAEKKMLIEIFTSSLKLLHPFMPFITEEIWKDIPQGWLNRNVGRPLLMVEKWVN